MTQLPSCGPSMFRIEQRWLNKFNHNTSSVIISSRCICRFLLLLANDMFQFDTSNKGNWEFDFESCGRVVDVIRESSFHCREITNEIHRSTSNSMPASNG